VDGCAIADRNAGRSIDDPYIVEHCIDQAAGGTGNGNAIGTHVSDGRVQNRQGLVGTLVEDAGRRAAEIPVHQAVLDTDEASQSGAGDIDGDRAAVKALEIDVADVHGLPHIGSRQRSRRRC
jgi:hypothetical protein